MTQQDLADACGAIGYPIHRLTIAKVEKGGTRANRAPLEEVLAFAAALGVAPVHLLAPLEDDATVQVTGAITAPAPRLRLWVRGGYPLRDDDAERFVSEMPRSEVRALLHQRALEGLDPLEREVVGKWLDDEKGEQDG